MSKAKKTRVSVLFSKESPIKIFLSFVKMTFVRSFIGLIDFNVYRNLPEINDLEADSQTMFSILAAFLVCFSFGLINLSFIFAFWFLSLAQFKRDFIGGLHAASVDIITGASMLICIYAFGMENLILLAYPITAVFWVQRYLFAKESKVSVCLLQLGKVIVFVLSKYIPTLILYYS